MRPCCHHFQKRRAVWIACALSCLLFSEAGITAADWESGAGFRSIALAVPAQGHTGFTLLGPEQTGIVFSNIVTLSRYTTNQIYLNGSGVAAADIDGDGRCDLFFGGMSGGSALYRNLGGCRFTNVTVSAGLALSGLDVSGCALADINGDGVVDLIVNTVGQGTYVFLNDGHGHFRKGEVLNPRKAGMTLALADIDGDGTLDLYIANYRTSTMRDEPNTKVHIDMIGGKPVVTEANGRPTTEPDLVGRYSLGANGEVVENGEPDLLLRNDGHGHFAPVSFTDGSFLDEDGKPLTSPLYDWGLSAMFRDINGDGAPDLYVCNDFASPDRIWINTGNGHFRAIQREALRHTSMFSMGVDFADLNRDGHDDFFVADMLSPHHARRMVQTGNVPAVSSKLGDTSERLQYSHNTLLINRGDTTFAEIAFFAGVEATEWSWSPTFLDVDLDGYEDLLIANGHQRDAMNIDIIHKADALMAQKRLSNYEMMNLNNLFPHLLVPKVAFRNRGNLTFEEVGHAWGFDTICVSQGVALADLDGDGDLDVIVNNMNGVAGVYRNESAAPRLAVRLRGASANTRGIGARIKVFGGAVPMQSQEMICGGRYLSSDDAMRVFGAGTLTNRLRIEVDWRSGKRSVVDPAYANRLYEVDEDGASLVGQPSVVSGQSPVPEPASHITDHASRSIFQDVSAMLNHTHHEDYYDDFGRQPLLWRKLSQLGPGVCWYDVDGDGWEDLAITSGRGGHLAVYHNDQGKGFTLLTGAALHPHCGRDLTTVLGVGSVLLTGSSNYEDGKTNGGCLRVYNLPQQATGESILGQPWARGPLAVGDMDGNGQWTLFIGGRSVPGRFPEPAGALLVNQSEGRFHLRQKFEKLGLVSGAIWSDLDGDGQAELILACEWGPVRVFRKGASGELEEITKRLGLAEYTGWWNGVNVGDFDGDGRLDIVASNWGENSVYRTSREHPLRVYYGDLGGQPGSVDLLEVRYDPELQKEVPLRGWAAVRKALPFLQEKIASYDAYGRAGVADLYGARLQQTPFLEVTTLASMVFLNRGDHFEAHRLPDEAQWAAAFGVSVGDMDGDGHEDVFLSQNFFEVNSDMTRSDAGRGLWLRGDGKGGFMPVPGTESGIAAYGEQRGCALADFDGDGRVDLVVTQNGAATKLYRNVGARPGLRVHVEGPPDSPGAVGAQIRLYFGQRAGPVREIHAGGGYWSQDGGVQVMGTPEPPTRIEIRWPGSKTSSAALPPDAREVTLTSAGAFQIR
jgi:hypothetical protein